MKLQVDENSIRTLGKIILWKNGEIKVNLELLVFTYKELVEQTYRCWNPLVYEQEVVWECLVDWQRPGFCDCMGAFFLQVHKVGAQLCQSPSFFAPHSHICSFLSGPVQKKKEKHIGTYINIFLLHKAVACREKYFFFFLDLQYFQMLKYPISAFTSRG